NYHNTQNKSYDAPPTPLLAPIADCECLAHTNRLRSPIELLASERNHYTLNRFANIWSVFALHPEDTIMIGLGEVANLKINGRKGVK
ncbi:hypothetical protein DL95DRAFT_395175, partial [Leptodontidium sp. 2 PMI_412]